MLTFIYFFMFHVRTPPTPKIQGSAPHCQTEISCRRYLEAINGVRIHDSGRK